MARDAVPARVPEQKASDPETAAETAKESDPLMKKQAASPTRASFWAEQAVFLFWASAVIISSTCLINYNKYLMRDDVFPFPVPLVMIHMLASTVFGLVLLQFFPSLFPSLKGTNQTATINVNYIVGRVAPIALLQAASLTLSNTAYKYASVSLLQMMKQGNVLLVYMLSLVVGIEAFRGKQAVMLVFIVGAMYASLTGDLHFTVIAFVVQGACCFAESSKIVLQGVLLSARETKLDPMSFVLFVSPIVFVLLLSLSAVQVIFPFHALDWLSWPTWSNIMRVKVVLLGNVFVAFMLNVITAIFLRYGSPLGFLLTNILKDGLIVVGSAAFMNEPLSSVQMISFPIQLSLIFLYSLSKTFTQTFETDGFQGLFKAIVTGRGQ